MTESKTDLSHLLHVDQSEANDLALRDLPENLREYIATGAPHMHIAFTASMARELGELIDLAYRVQAEPCDIRETPLQRARRSTKQASPERFPMARFYGAELGKALRYSAVAYLCLLALNDILP